MAILFTSFIWYNNTEWSISEDYSIKFKSDNPSGVFTSFKGKIIFAPDHLESSSFNLIVDVKSINTGNGIKNKHALSKNWFDEKRFPEITFTSSQFEQSGSGFSVIGTMTIHGVPKVMSIPFTFKDNTFKSNFKIDRTDFNVGSTKGMSSKAATKLDIEVSVPVSKI
ncbi:MAG: YceI family protein [Bacteroidota bacterium]